MFLNRFYIQLDSFILNIFFYFLAGAAIGRLNITTDKNKEKIYVLIYFKEISGDKVDEKIMKQDPIEHHNYARNLNILMVDQSKLEGAEKNWKEKQKVQLKYKHGDHKWEIWLPNNKCLAFCPSTSLDHKPFELQNLLFCLF